MYLKNYGTLPSQGDGARPGIGTLLCLSLDPGVNSIGLELLRGYCVCVSVGWLY